MKTYEQIAAAVDHALSYVRSGWSDIPDLASMDTQQYEALADMRDDAILTEYAPKLPDLGPTAVTVTTIEEFRLLYDALGAAHSMKIPAQRIAGQIAHEQAHLAASARIGFEQLYYGLLITESDPGFHVRWRPFHAYAKPLGEVTKLAVASQLAAPAILSDGDRRYLFAMGYKGAADVGRRITTARDLRLSSLWVPESYSGRTSIASTTLEDASDRIAALLRRITMAFQE